MPYQVFKRDSQWAVCKINEDGEPMGEPLGKHDTEEEARAQQRALYASERKSHAVKMTDDGWIEGPGMPFGGPFNGKDVDGEFFSTKTNFAFDWFPERPLLYHHGLDKDAGISVVGRVKSWESKTDLGIWTKAQLETSNEYFEAIKELVRQGKLYFSSGTMRHLVKVNKSGEIERWPWVELSLTPAPANLLAEVEMTAAEKHFDVAGIKSAWDAAKAMLTTESRENLDDSDFAYIDSEGSRHLPIHDVAHVRNALARFNQTQFESEDAKEKAKRKILARAKQLGVEVSEEKSAELRAMSRAGMRNMTEGIAKRMGMSMSDSDMDAMMEDMEDMMDEPVQRIMSEMTDRLQAMQKQHKASNLDEILTVIKAVPFVSHAEIVTDMVASFSERTKDLQERRLKEGRAISAANRKRIQQCMETMRLAMTEMETLTAEPEQQAKAVLLLWQLKRLQLAN